MLNLSIAMFLMKFGRAFFLIVSVLIIETGNGYFLDSLNPESSRADHALGGRSGFAAAQETPQPEVGIRSPGGGEALQGVVAVNGVTQVQDFRSAEIAFAYESDPTGTWFLIQQSDTAQADGLLASWDTSTITDGQYRLRVQVVLQDGQVIEKIVSGLRVRNYTLIETSTPELAAPRRETATMTPLPPPDYQVIVRTPQAAPTNPVQITGQDFQASLLRGVAMVVGFLLVGGLYWGLRALLRR